MKISKLFLVSILVVSVFYSCSSSEKDPGNLARIAISSDIETLNPLFSFTVNEGNITELLFLSLVQHKWNEETGTLDTYPMLAKKWEWFNDKKSVRLFLRDDVKWSDGKPFTAEDVVFSLEAYSDPELQSRLVGAFENYYTDGSGKILSDKSFEITDQHTMIIHFNPDSKPNYFDFDYPLVSKSAYAGIAKENYATADINFKPITNGPFSLETWERDRAIVLKRNPQCFLNNDGGIEKIIFKIVPEYTSRLNLLKTNEIDFLEEIKPNDALYFKNSEDIIVRPIDGREYDYIGWNHFEPVTEADQAPTPNKLFSTAEIRTALAMAMNRQEIISSYLNNYGDPAVTPISSIFTGAVNTDLQPLEFDQAEAVKILNEAGWRDTDQDGILDKDGTAFKFTLSMPAGNPRRNYASTIFQKNLSDVGISMEIESLEMGVFLDKLFSQQLDAWMVANYIPIPILLKPYWYSDLNAAPVNFSGYRNTEVDELIDKLRSLENGQEKNSLYKKFQEIIYGDQPVAFLYWVDNITAHNSRIKNIEINPLGFIQHCWEWETGN